MQCFWTLLKIECSIGFCSVVSFVLCRHQSWNYNQHWLRMWVCNYVTPSSIIISLLMVAEHYQEVSFIPHDIPSISHTSFWEVIVRTIWFRSTGAIILVTLCNQGCDIFLLWRGVKDVVCSRWSLQPFCPALQTASTNNHRYELSVVCWKEQMSQLPVSHVAVVQAQHLAGKRLPPSTPDFCWRLVCVGVCVRFSVDGFHSGLLTFFKGCF